MQKPRAISEEKQVVQSKKKAKLHQLVYVTKKLLEHYIYGESFFSFLTIWKPQEFICKQKKKTKKPLKEVQELIKRNYTDNQGPYFSERSIEVCRKESSSSINSFYSHKSSSYNYTKHFRGNNKYKELKRVLLRRNCQLKYFRNELSEMQDKMFMQKKELCDRDQAIKQLSEMFKKLRIEKERKINSLKNELEECMIALDMAVRKSPNMMNLVLQELIKKNQKLFQQNSELRSEIFRMKRNTQRRENWTQTLKKLHARYL